MSESYTFFSQDLSACNETEAWWNMINCIVNFISASTNLATNLENNHVGVRRNPTWADTTKPKSIAVANNLVDSSVQCTEVKISPKELTADEMCLTDFPHFVDELTAENEGISPDKPTAINTSSGIISPKSAPLPMFTKVLEETPVEHQNTLKPEPIINLQDKGDYSKLETIPRLVAPPTQQSDEGIEIRNKKPNKNGKKDDEKENKTKNRIGEHTKTPSNDSCFFQEYTDSDQSIYSSDISTTIDEQTTELENSVKDSITTKQENVKELTIDEKAKQIEEIRKALLRGMAKTNRVEKEIKQHLENENENKVFKPVDVRKSQKIQTSSTSRYNKTVRALITQSPELLKPIKDEIKVRKSNAKSSSLPENIPRAIPKSLNELKEQLDSIKIKPNATGSSSKRETVIPEKQIADLSKRLRNCQTKNKGIKKTATGEENLRAPRSSVINVKKEIIAEKGTTKINNPPRKLTKGNRRYDSIESVVKRMIQGPTKSLEQPSVDQNMEQPSDKQGDTRKQQNLTKNQPKKEDSSKLIADARNRSSSRSSTGSSVPSQKDPSDKPGMTFIVHKKIYPKTESLVKSLGMEGSRIPRSSTKASKNLKVITEEKRKKIKSDTQEVEEKKSISASKTPVTKSKLKAKSP